jgi:Putative MetA-pathway of phenol degradation
MWTLRIILQAIMHGTPDANLRRKFKAGLLTTVLSGLLVTALPAWCGAPFITDDPEPVEYQHHELTFASEQTSSEDSKSVTPSVEYSYGVLPDLQLSIIVPYVFNSPVGQPNQQGLGDIELGAKYRFLQETDSHPMMAFYPVVVVPSGNTDKGLGDGATQIFLPIWIQKNWGDWQTNAGGGYWISRVTGASNHWYFGGQLQKSISEHLTVGGEIFHETYQIESDVATLGFRLGGVYNFDAHNRLLLSIGRELKDVTLNRYSSFIAYGLTW